MDAERLLSIALLLVIGVVLGLLSMAEAGAITISRQRARLLAERGERHGRALHRQAIERAATYASFTVIRSALLIGGTILLAGLLIDALDDDLAALALAYFIALGVTLLLEIAPGYIAVQQPERWALPFTPVVQAIRVVVGPIAWLFTLPAQVWLRLRGVGGNGGDEVSEAEELLRQVEMERGEEIEREEAEMIRGIFGLEDTTAREVMVPRIDMVAVEAGESVETAVQTIVEKGVSRIPVYKDTIDNIVGIVYAKDLLRYLAAASPPVTLTDLARPAHFIPETKRTDELLRELRQSKVHIAIVVDEYGGTAGLVTIEDLLEEIVGEIEDEYDIATQLIEVVSEAEAVLDARVPVDELNELFGIEVDHEDYDTVGGFVYHHLGTIPSVGDEIEVDGIHVRILSVEDRRIKKVHMRRVQPPDPGAGAERRERAS
ncbi:MAG TPA: hemolysin family protein [Dehalococcoidia bacterium]|nr:hemolysin family protein [Dehalococcoidia bacterium]